jgi:transcriptional regulator with XRE-family HTH domain
MHPRLPGDVQPRTGEDYSWSPEEAYPLTRDEAYGIRSFGQIVRRARYSVGATQRMVGRRIGVSQSVVSRLENGKLKGLSFRKVGRLIALLDGRVEFWIGRTMEPSARRLPTYPADARPEPAADDPAEPAVAEPAVAEPAVAEPAVDRPAEAPTEGHRPLAATHWPDPATDREG